MMHLSKSIFAVGAAFVALCAVAGHGLPINGEFHGSPGNNHRIPGWRTTTAGGIRFFPLPEGRHMMQLTSRRHPKVAVSDLHSVTPGVLELGADVSGVGTASLGFEAYDASQRIIVQSGKQSWQLSETNARIKFNFPVTDPNVAFIRITLTAEAGSVARFTDVNAVFKYGSAPVPPPPPPVAQPLMDGGFYTLESLPPVAVFQVAVPSGRAISFKLGQVPMAGEHWGICRAYDPNVCRFGLQRARVNSPYTRVTLKAVRPGTTTLEFFNRNAGKRVIIHFTAL